MGSAVLLILRSIVLIYSAGSGANRVQVVLSGFSVRLFCFASFHLTLYGFVVSVCYVGLASLDVVCDELLLANFHMCGIMLVLKAVFNMLVRNAIPGGTMCFRCLIFSLSGPCELLFFLYFIASWT